MSELECDASEVLRDADSAVQDERAELQVRLGTTVACGSVHSLTAAQQTPRIGALPSASIPTRSTGGD